MYYTTRREERGGEREREEEYRNEKGEKRRKRETLVRRDAFRNAEGRKYSFFKDFGPLSSTGKLIR